MGYERRLDDALAGAGLPNDEAEAALLAVHPECIENLLLMGEEIYIFVGEWSRLQAEVGADHDLRLDLLGGRSLATRSRGRASPMRSPL